MARPTLRAFRSLAASLALVVAGALLRADSPWLEVRSPHFIVKSDASLGFAKDVAAAFENMREVFRLGYPNLRVDPRNPLIILAVKDEASMRALEPAFWEDRKTIKPVGVYHHGHGQDFVVLRADLWSLADQEHHDVYHEYTHSILHLNFRDLPLWLNEGLAEYYGDTVFERSEVSIGKMNRWRLRYLDQSTWLPWETLLTVNHQSPHYQEWATAGVFYSQSWILVRYMLQAPEAVQNQTFQKYLGSWLATGDSERAARESLGDLGVLQSKVKLYMDRKVHGYQRLSFNPIVPDKTFVARTLTPAEAWVAQGQFFEGTGEPKAALPLLQKALEADPGFGPAHTALGILAREDKDGGKAETLLLEGLKLSPEDFLPALELGLNALEHSGQAAPEQVVAWLETATRLNPGSARAFDALARAYAAMPEQQARAIGAEKMAFQLDTMELGYLASYGRLCLASGKLPEARGAALLLKKLGFTAQDKALTAGFLAELAQVEARTAKAATK